MHCIVQSGSAIVVGQNIGSRFWKDQVQSPNHHKGGITKAARYGIKLYVITDAETAYVLRVIIYTGKTTYTAGTTGEVLDKKKTVQIVSRLVEPFVGSHRTIYVDRFYTLIDLLKALLEKDLYLTGTMMANQLP